MIKYLLGKASNGKLRQVCVEFHEDWNEEYQSLLSQERKYLYALNRIEQYETEQRISEFEEKLNDIESV